jgi:hypothetical protein
MALALQNGHMYLNLCPHAYARPFFFYSKSGDGMALIFESKQAKTGCMSSSDSALFVKAVN